MVQRLLLHADVSPVWTFTKVKVLGEAKSPYALTCLFLVTAVDASEEDRTTVFRATLTERNYIAEPIENFLPRPVLCVVRDETAFQPFSHLYYRQVLQ